MNCVLQSCFLTSVAKYESMLLCSFGLYRIKRGTVKVSTVVLTCFTWSTFAALKWLWKIKKTHVRYSTAVRNCKVNIVYLSNVYKCIDRRGCFDAEVDKILFLKRSLKAECGTCVHMCPLSALSQVPGTELMSVWWRARCISFILGLVRRLRGVWQTAWWSILCLFQELNGLHCFGENWEETCCRLSGCRLQCKETQVKRSCCRAADPLVSTPKWRNWMCVLKST